MSDIDELLARQARRAVQDGRPVLQVAVVTCMDCRIDPVWLLGLKIGDVHILRNAGGLITDDVLRSLALSQRALGTRAVLVVHHTDCGMRGFDDAAFRQRLADESGRAPEWNVPGFDDVHAQVRASVRTVRECPWLPHREEVRGAVYDVTTGELISVE